MNRSWLKQVGLLFLVFSLLLSPFNATPAYALDAPDLISPEDGVTTTVEDTPPLGIPEFKWAAVADATKYRLQVSSDIAFTTTIVNITTTNTSYTPTSANTFSDGTWYWRVRVDTPTPAGEYSPIWSFTKEWASDTNFPLLNSPDDTATLDFYDPPAFSWEPVTGAVEYKLQIYASPGGWATPTYSVVTLATTHQRALKLTNGLYYWRVVPVDVGGREGTPSEERSFTAGYNLIPTLLEPAHNATPTFTPNFRWTAVRGAQYYRLQYTTDPDFSSGIVEIDTRNTSYTPIGTLSNDINYYWRVRTHSGSSISNWSPIRTFVKRWYIKPVLLTPTNGYQYVRFPFFSWAPVPGAAKYLVELSKFPGFVPLLDSGETANTFYSPDKYDGGLALTYYWRVTPIDGSNKLGRVSDTFSFNSYYNSVAPQLVYPLYYYVPNSFAGFPGVTTSPYEDRTAALPIFIWHRVLKPLDDPTPGDDYADAYRLQVSTSPTFVPISWTVDTENTSATPTSTNPFTPSPNTDYYWRVRPLVGGAEAAQWSEVWRTRFNTSGGLTPTAGSTPTLIRPVNGFELAESTPLLEWFPMSGATSYEVQISQAQDFTGSVSSATVNYPAYVPSLALAQRNLGDVDFGVYYWRVRKAGGSWSETRRFQVAAQSQWAFTRTLGSGNQLQIGSDTNQGSEVLGNAAYNLTSLYAAQSNSTWYFGFNVPTSPAINVTYALYLDLDHQENSGAASDPRGYSLTTISTYRPEYAIYILQKAGAYSTTDAYLYRWNGVSWDAEQDFTLIGGQLSYSSGYLELALPNTVIGYQDTTGSYAVSLLSLPASSGQPQDSVPSSPNIPGGTSVSRFSNVTERMNLLMPPTNAGVDPSTYPSVLPFIWDYSIRAPYSGAFMKVYTDPLFTTEVAEYEYKTSDAYWADAHHAWYDDFSGDNTYYWRVQPRYRVGSNLYSGVWTQGWRFERKGFVPQNLQTSVTFATPTFSWSMVEGAQYYTIWVDEDPSFGSPINETTRQTFFTSTNTLAQGTYYWKVRVHRFDGVTNAFSPTQSFTLALPTPSGLEHFPAGTVDRAPTLCWTPLIVDSPSTGDPVMAAWKYRVQVSKEPTFSSIFDNTDTEQSCWTPIQGYDDGSYYWRIAMFDGQGKLGNYSTAATFTKQYPVTTLVSPTSGASTTSTPTFVWTPVHGAAEYKFESSKNPTFSPIYDTITTDNTRWTPIKTYDRGATYYWRVSIVDDDGNFGPVVGSTIIIPSDSATFVDVPKTYWAWQYIERLYAAGITGGCATTPALLYCPENPVTRAQMAIFLEKAMKGSSFVPPDVAPTFSDTVGHWAENWIEALKNDGVTSGCGSGKYCPDNPVTRAQMAVFLLKAKYGSSYSPPAVGASTGFADVPTTYWAAAWIKQLAAEGVTGGCGSGNYCPENAVTRAQMAVFLVKAFSLP
ncbi:MAG: hypothetical protein CVU44_13650 [Chloroflexi bacterium HGW-Chloroflexi-6]|nr:MAG: hypothetical protein CVU44_13650 [Chloroflexi bacterium HGW-Chloroflexi-6]